MRQTPDIRRNRERRKHPKANGIFDHLEQRLLFSYSIDTSNPQSVINAGAAVIAETPEQVITTAGDGISGKLSGPISPVDPAMAEVIAYHEGYVGSVYLDTKGNATVGYGLLLTPSNKAFANQCLSSVGLTMAKVLADAKSNPGASILTPDQAWTVLLYAVYLKFNVAARVYGPQFYELDRDPQIALVDMTYRGDVPGITGPDALKADIAGTADNDYATDYSAASSDVFSAPAGRQSDDQALMLDGQYPTTFTIDPLSLDVGDTETLNVTTQGAKGKGIILSTDDVDFESDTTNVATVDPDTGDVTGVSQGSATVTETLFDNSDFTATSPITVGQAPGVFNLPTDGTPVPLDGVAPGTPMSIKIDYATTDENENGEGESLLIMNAAGDTIANDASYNATSVYTYTAQSGSTGSMQSTVDTLAAVPQGWDGDESAVVTAYVVSATAGVTAPQQAALSNASSDLDTAATGSATVANAFAADLQSGSPSYDLGAENAAWTAAALESDASADFSSLAIDPIDRNYKVIVHPGKTTSAIFSTAKNFKGIKTAGALSATINALDLNEERSINLAAAAYETSNKLDGAVAAGNAVWTKRQTATLKSYLKQLAVLLKSQPLLSNSEAVQLNKSGLGSTTVASTDVNNFEETVNDDGLPTQLVTDLNALGVSSATQSQIQQALFAQDIDTASGTYSSILTNASLEAELTQVAALLKAG